MSNNTMSEEEKHLLAVFSANFNDGESIETRVGSRDMKNVSVIVEFIKDYVAPYVVSKQIEARIDEMSMLENAENEMFRLAGSEANPSGEQVVAGEYAHDRLIKLRKQQEEL